MNKKGKENKRGLPMSTMSFIKTTGRIAALSASGFSWEVVNDK
jgi:hypothetical protein